ncbi:TonB-dependent receptor [Hirschia maritima]|uniref:TonB-dependent receptor n=1 Tax=Hirschia maritima TaxID=1121961 RepID=UPI00036FCFA4|nr:TonB-dependent receptor [Hirschia maritima]
MIKSKLFRTTATLLALQGMASFGTYTTAMAQETDTNEASRKTLDTITVTTRKQEETILDVPVAVTAFGADAIEELGLDSLEDVQNFTAGFTYESFGTTAGRLDNVPRFRGVTTNTANPTRQTASVFIDGVYVANGVQGINFENIERIEAIKGPQSAFYGRSTFGGAINFITKTPGDEFEGRVTASGTTRNDYAVSGRVAGPLAGDWLSGALSARYNDKEGHYESTTDGGTLGSEETWSATGTLFVVPNNDLDIKLQAAYFENEDNAPAIGFVGQDLLNCGPTDFETNANFPSVVPGQAGPLGGQEAFFCGTLPILSPNIPSQATPGILTALEGLETPINGSEARRAGKGFGLDRSSLRLSSVINYTIPNTDVEISSITGLNKEEVNQARPGEGNNLGPSAFYAANAREFNDFSQELRVSGNAMDDKINWSIGGNYFDQELKTSGVFGLLSGFTFGNGANFDVNKIETLGAFGSVNIQATEKLNVAIEGRYQQDKISEDGNATDTNPPLTETFNSFLPRVILEYKPDDETLLYASYSEGNLPGGFNNDFIELNEADRTIVRSIQPFSSENFDEEKLANYEVGAKRNFSDGSGFVSMAAFYMDRTGQTLRDTTQANLSTGFEFITQFLNIGRSEIYGLEVEGTWIPFDGLTLDGSIAYTDAEFDVFESANALRVFGRADVSGNAAERSPKVSGSFSWKYENAINSDWEWFIRNDNTYTGDRYASEVNLAIAEGQWINNIRLGASNDKYRIEFFGENISGADTPTAAVRSTDLGAVVTRTNGARPFGYLIGLRDRNEYGIRLSVNF